MKRKDLTHKESPLTSLSKFVALSGVCSRRKAVEMIENGLVTVNGEVIREPGFKIDEKNTIVKAGGRLVQPEEKVYVLLNKPKDYITTVVDEKGRKTVMELIQLKHEVRLYPVGRLDRSTTGLLLLTNDGELALRLAHPRYEVKKTYHVTLEKPLSFETLKRIGQEGIELEDGLVMVDAIGFMPGEKKKQVVIELHSGKFHVVRRIFEAVGNRVDKLDRVIYANLTKAGLRSGQWRFLTHGEVAQLKKMPAKKKKHS